MVAFRKHGPIPNDYWVAFDKGVLIGGAGDIKTLAKYSVLRGIYYEVMGIVSVHFPRDREYGHIWSKRI